MVGIIKEQTRNYVADMASANATAINAQNVGELRSLWGGVSNFVNNVQQEKEKQRKKEEKELEDADINMINTEIGGTLSNELMGENARRVADGTDPNTPAYNQWLESERQRIFQPYIDQMQSEKGKAALQKMARDTTDKIVSSNIGKIAQNRKKAQAAGAFVSTGKQLKNDAYGFGQLGDWDGFQDATKAQKDAMLKYAKKNGGEEAVAETEYAIDTQNILAFYNGMAESDPEKIIAMLDAKGNIRQQLEERRAELDKARVADGGKPYTDAELDKLAETMMAKGEYKNASDQFEGIIPDSIRDHYTANYEKRLQGRIAELKERQKSLAKGSDAHKNVEKQIKDLQDKLANPDAEVTEMIKSDLRKLVLPKAKKQVELNKLAKKKQDQEQYVHNYTMVMSPDNNAAFDANMAILFGKQNAEELFGKSISQEAMDKAYERYKENDNKVVLNTVVDFDATEAIADGLANIRNYQGEDPLPLIKYALEIQADLGESANMTESQKQNVKNILFAAVQDKGFGDVMSSVLSSDNRYFPDTSWGENIFGSVTNRDFYGERIYPDMSKGEVLDIMGLPSSDIKKQDIDEVRKYMKTESVRVINDVMSMLAVAAQEPDKERRLAMAQEAAKYLASEKQKVYDTAMRNYGIDLAKLREVKATRGQAFTQIGTQLKEYLGDDPSTGEPLWGDYYDTEQAKQAQKRLVDTLTVDISQFDEKGEKDGRK